MQIFGYGKGFVYVAAMNNVSESPKSLKMSAKEVVVPEAIITDYHYCHKYLKVR